MNDSNDIYKPPNADLDHHKQDEIKNEKKILKDFCALFDNEDKFIRRRKMIANVFLLIAGAGTVLLFFIYYQAIEITPTLLIFSVLVGLFFGLGIWFMSFVMTWPVVRLYVNKEQMYKRFAELDK